MRKANLGGMALAAILAGAVAGYGAAASAQPVGAYGPGSGGMGPGMMYGYGGDYAPGPWMMGGGMGPGAMYGYGGGYGAGGHSGAQQPADLNLTVAQVRDNMEQWLEAAGNPHVKLGAVKAKDANTITADIVTTDKDALVERYDINRHSGYVQPDRG